MEFLDKLVLPQSAEHIELLTYMLILILFLFIPFISVILGGTSLSLYFRKKGTDAGNPLYLKFAKDVIDLLTINKSAGIILGILPLLTSVLIYAQLLHKANIGTLSYLVGAFFLATISIILIYTYRYSLSFTSIFNSIKDLKTDEPELKEELDKFKKGNQSLSIKSGIYGLLLLFVSLWIFVASVTLVTFPEKWEGQELIFLVFSWQVLSGYIQFIAAAFAITGGAILFGFFYWEGGRKNLSDNYKDFVRNISVKIAFAGAIFQPLFLLINLLALPGEALSASVFSYSFIALFLLFLAYHYLYAMIKESTLKFSGQVFYVLLFALLALIIKDQLAMSNATRTHSVILSTEFNQYLAELKGEGAGTEQLNGQEIYDVRCASCHQFEQKLVGPPHNEVLPKYVGNKEQLVAFIRNPVKINPAYPPMPNPGLKPNEADAVATYLLEEFEEKKQ
jgi:cytochrome c